MGKNRTFSGKFFAVCDQTAPLPGQQEPLAPGGRVSGGADEVRADNRAAHPTNRIQQHEQSQKQGQGFEAQPPEHLVHRGKSRKMSLRPDLPQKSRRKPSGDGYDDASATLVSW